METDWRSKSMAYLCEKALPKMPKRLLIEIAKNLNQSQGLNISIQQSTKKTIIKSIFKEKVETAHYWQSFDHVIRNNIAILKNELIDIKRGTK